MRPTTRQTFTRCLFAVGATIVGLFAMNVTASAAVTEAPEITIQPTNPNTTHAESTFEYSVGDGETSTAATLRFYCRVYDADGTPPAPAAGWGGCGTTTSAAPQPASKTYTQANGNWTFDVAVRESSNFLTQGPVASSTWVQNLAAPSLAPVLTQTPDNPMRELPTTFTYTASATEEQLVDRFECRLDDDAWEDCTSNSAYVATPKNGEHHFEVRAGNVSGYGPTIEPFSWVGDVPNPGVHAYLEKVSPTQLQGDTPLTLIGGLAGLGASSSGPTNLGDVNDDGVEDLALATGNQTSGDSSGVYVIFGSENGLGHKSLSSLGPDQGFMIKYGSGSSNTVRGYRSIGDQNGDGVRDMVIAVGQSGTIFTPVLMNYVIYGGTSAHELATCPGSTTLRCLDLSTLSDNQGYVLTSPPNIRLGYGGFIGTLDFNGDGTEDIAFGSYNSGNANVAYVVSGGERIGTNDITSLPSDQVFRVDGGPGSNLGYGVSGVGDLNVDGKDELYVGAASTGGGYILYGRSFGTVLDIESLGLNDGVRHFGPPLQEFSVENLGDVNGDGRSELAFAPTNMALRGSDAISVLYGLDLPTTEGFVVGDDLVPGTGYLIEPGGYPAFLGQYIENIGDFNNDGIPDFVSSASETPVDGEADAGAAYVIFGKSDSLDESVQLGPELTPSIGIALLGGELRDQAGISVTSIGDTDDDGLGDFAVGAPWSDPNGVDGAGTVYIVQGKSLMNQVRTGDPVSINNESAQLKAPVQINGRDTEVWFEYGTTDEYGDISESREFEASNSGDAAVVGIDGLAKATTYHYRAVAKNELGLVRYGDDRTFTTSNVPDPDPVDNCDIDPTNPGCAEYCSANPTAMGCPDYDWCANNPGKCDQGGGKTRARLALISTTKRIAVKRGRLGVLRVAVVNTGGKRARGVRVCVRAPKRLVRVKRCVRVGKLASGKSRIVKVKVKAKRKRGKATLRITANGKNVSAKRTRARVVIR